MVRRSVIAALVVIMIMGIGAGSASAAAPSFKAGSAGINVDVNDGLLLSGKVFVSSSIAVLAGFGLGINGGDTTGTDLSLAVGARKYLKMDDFAPFVGGFFDYGTSEKGNHKTMDLLAEAGAEYFLAKQFSIEGKVGFGYMYQERSTSNSVTFAGNTFTTETTQRNNTVGTKRFGISFNYYFF